MKVVLCLFVKRIVLLCFKQFLLILTSFYHVLSSCCNVSGSKGSKNLNVLHFVFLRVSNKAQNIENQSIERFATFAEN